MSPTVSQLRLTMLVLLCIYLCVWPGSTALVALDRVPDWGVWMGGALLMLQGLLMGLWLTANHGWRGAMAACAILVLGWAVEHLGVTTGFPFGSYSYTDMLQPKIGGVVPLAIPFAWLMVVPTSIGVAEQLLARIHMQHEGQHLLLKIITAASLALLLDLTIEPVAVHINNYWVWPGGGIYYGVPVSNFVAWWSTGIVIVSVVLRLLPTRFKKARGKQTRVTVLPPLPLALYLLNSLMFALVNLAHHQLLAAAIGLVLLGTLVWYLRPQAMLQDAAYVSAIASSIARTRRRTHD